MDLLKDKKKRGHIIKAGQLALSYGFGLSPISSILLSFSLDAVNTPGVQNQIANKIRLITDAISSLNPQKVKYDLIKIGTQDISNIDHLLSSLEKRSNQKSISGPELTIVNSMKKELHSIKTILQHDIDELSQENVNDPDFPIKIQSFRLALENTEIRFVSIETELLRIIDVLDEEIQRQKTGFNKDIILSAKEDVVSTTFDGSPVLIIVGILNLIRRFPNACVLISPSDIRIDSTLDFGTIMWDCGSFPLRRRLQFPTNYINLFISCLQNQNTRFIIMPLFLYGQLKCTSTTIPVDPRLREGHANYMIYDKKHNTLERFDPYGNEGQTALFEVKELDLKIKEEFEKLSTSLQERGLINEKIEYFSPMLLCPFGYSEGPQAIQEQEVFHKLKTDPVGFCAAWSTWYANLRLKNPDIPKEEIIQSALNSLRNVKKVEVPRGRLAPVFVPSISFTTFIRNYSESIMSEAKRLFSPIGYTDFQELLLSDGRIVQVLKEEFRKILTARGDTINLKRKFGDDDNDNEIHSTKRRKLR